MVLRGRETISRSGTTRIFSPCRIALLTLLLSISALAGATAAPAEARTPDRHPTDAPAEAGRQPWWAHAVIYEIYIRSFQDSNGDGVGDLNGITERLGYLHKLGVNAIWITPFFPSPNADFGYDVSNYEAVAPQYGTMQDFDRLTRKARKLGIRVLVDLVANHTSSKSPWFEESRSSRHNPKRDWYVWHDPAPGGGPPTNWKSIFGGSTWTYDKKTGQYYYHMFMPQEPDLNWNNPQVRKAIYNVMRFWLRHGASGFRLDAAPYLFENTNYPDDPDVNGGRPVWAKPYNSGLPALHGVMREMRKVVDEANDQDILLGETATATIAGLRAVYGKNGDEINLPMDFLYGNQTRLNAAVFKKQIDNAETKLDGNPPVFFFSSHDHERQWTSFGDGVHNARIARITGMMTLTLRGTALLYYGEEIGMADLSKKRLARFPLGPNRPVADPRDPERSPMQWTGGPKAGFTTGNPWLPIAKDARTRNVAAEMAEPHSMYHWYAKLIGLRKTNAALREGAYVPLNSGNPDVLVYARRDASGQGVLVLLNMSAKRQRLYITGWKGPAPEAGRVIMSSPQITKANLVDPVLAPYAATLVSFAPSRPK